MRSFFGAQIGQMANSTWRISEHRFGLNVVGEIERQFFCQTLCAGIFSFGKQSLGKSIPSLS